MPEAQHLADALKGLFGDPEHGLFTAFTVAVDGFTAAQAAAIPAPRFNSIWAVVNHVRFWQGHTLLRPRGLAIERQALGAANGWSPRWRSWGRVRVANRAHARAGGEPGACGVDRTDDG